MQKASEIPVGNRAVYGVHTYDMLKNPIYSHAFQYVPVFQIGNKIKRNDLIISEDQDNVYKCAQSDLVRLVLMLPYLPIEVQSKFRFDIEWYKAWVDGEGFHKVTEAVKK